MNFQAAMKQLPKNYYFMNDNLTRNHAKHTPQSISALHSAPSTRYILVNESAKIQSFNGHFLLKTTDFPANFTLNPAICTLLGGDEFGAIFLSPVTFSTPDQFEPIDAPNASISVIPALAASVVKFHQQVVFCTKCGEKLTFLGPENYFLGCNGCGKEYFPRIQPSMIVLVKCGPRMLLCKRHSTLFTHVCGFTEIVETVEQTVIRELKEEIGFDPARIVKFEQFQGSQPWPGRYCAMMMPFYIEVDQEFECVITPECQEYMWADEAEWRKGADRVDRKELDGDFTVRSKKTIARAMMEYFSSKGE